jgi:hypothetical protein
MHDNKFLLVFAFTFTTYAQQPTQKPLPPLQNTHRITLRGKVKQATTQLPNATTGVVTPATPELCQFEMKLKPGQNHIEARLVGPVRKTGSGCEGDFDIGIPTVIQPAPQSFGASLVNGTTMQSTVSPTSAVTGETIELGHDDGNAPDLAPIFGNTPSHPGQANAYHDKKDGGEAFDTQGPQAVTGQPQFSSGIHQWHCLRSSRYSGDIRQPLCWLDLDPARNVRARFWILSLRDGVLLHGMARRLRFTNTVHKL